VNAAGVRKLGAQGNALGQEFLLSLTNSEGVREFIEDLRFISRQPLQGCEQMLAQYPG